MEVYIFKNMLYLARFFYSQIGIITKYKFITFSEVILRAN